MYSMSNLFPCARNCYNTMGFPMMGTMNPAGPMVTQPQMPSTVTTGMQSVVPAPIQPLGITAVSPADTTPVTIKNPDYLPGFLATQIGRKVRIEFLIGTNLLLDRMGTLLKVGANYVLIREEESDDVIAADLYSIRFVKIYY